MRFYARALRLAGRIRHDQQPWRDQARRPRRLWIKVQHVLPDQLGQAEARLHGRSPGTSFPTVAGRFWRTATVDTSSDTRPGTAAKAYSAPASNIAPSTKHTFLLVSTVNLLDRSRDGARQGRRTRDYAAVVTSAISAQTWKA